MSEHQHNESDGRGVSRRAVLHGGAMGHSR